MSVALVFVVSFALLVVAPPVLLALFLRLIAAPRSTRDPDCRPSGRPVLTAASQETALGA